MAEEFGKSGDQTTGEKDNAQGFNQNQTDQSGEGSLDITAEELAALKKRDEAAQAHITRLETENLDLRDEKSELSNALSSATTLDDVITRLDGKGGDTKPVDPESVVEQVEQRLQQKASQRTQDDNWNTVVAKVTETYGEFSKADVAIQQRAVELNMSTQEATDLAKRSPAAFYELFLPKSQAPVQSSASSATGKQTFTPPPTDGSARDREYYKDLRKKNPNKFWTAEVQAQYRRDLYGA